MTKPDQAESAFPALRDVIDALFPESRKHPSRRLIIGKSEDPSLDELERGLLEIEDPRALELLSPPVVAAIINELAKHQYRDASRVASLTAKIVGFINDYWPRYVAPLSQHVLANPYFCNLFDALPALRHDPTLLAVLTARIAHDEHFSLGEATKILQNVDVSSQGSVRAVLASLNRRRPDRSREEWQEAAIALFASAARGMGWNSWLILVGILISAPKFADEPLIDSSLLGPSRASAEIKSAFRDFEAQVRANPTVRALAVRIQDLLDGDISFGVRGLLDRPAETRAAYVNVLADICGHDATLRQAAIEMLLWLPRERAVDFAQFAATRLAHSSDKSFLKDLSAHPDRLVAYGAEAVQRAVFGERLGREISLPSAGGSVIESLADIGVNFQVDDEPPRTWLGDRIVERLIEKTISAVEGRFAKEYVDHSEDGEEKLLAMMFEALSSGFAALDASLEAIARAATSPRRASVSMCYRTIDKAEEGAAGVKGSKSFSADLCLIVDPVLDGRSLGRRVTLVQAKRLYRQKPLRAVPKWHHSFQLKAGQLQDLMKQTASSVFFFQGPVLGGRGVPVIPTQLVHDLASHQGGTGTRLAHEQLLSHRVRLQSG